MQAIAGPSRLSKQSRLSHVTDTSPSSSPIQDDATMSSTSYRHRRPRRRPRFSTISLLLLALVATLLFALPASASEGDRSPEYRLCVNSCTADVCRDNVDDGTMFAHRLPFILRLTRWTCEDDCKYHCTHRITNDAAERVHKIQHDARLEVEQLAESQPISASAKAERIRAIIETQMSALRPVQKQMVQFHGKWVFIRFLGAQEPLSVLFSLLNWKVHWNALFMMRKQLPDAFPLKLVYIVHTLISMNAWLWSAVFHTRDTNWTEKLDYFSAASVIMSAFFFSATRLFRIAPGSGKFVLFRRVCMGALGLHVLYLSIGRFDYAYNMAANVVVGLIHTLLWLTYSLRPTTFPSNPLVDRTAYSRAAMRAAKPSLSALSTPTPLTNGAATPPVPVSTNIGPPSTHARQRRRLQLILGLMSASVLLELLDFAPVLRILDAHALWHLATVPITKMWYDWLVSDAQECVSTGWWLSDRSVSAHGGEIASTLEQLSEKLKGRAASLAQNIELNALTSKLNELANKAGFSGSAGGASGGVNGASGLGLEMEQQPTSTGGAATSTSIALGAMSLTDRDAVGTSGGGAGKAKNW
ncbi:related to PER1 protein, involved in manganese homeostasis [Sporisorium reilianum f. sp. reilianum]|uniref:Related to PER1 protein, involved in manganese homeostasis n=1 Tax=Sporisorium reilianum f. sp. reilianum TaxID=72559 RepID=A0A2N8UKM7_9BASI|nr:related to PER1 protein, involved in manganese homeostasis [Sporisorium reilianum f. sp. reilianum]